MYRQLLISAVGCAAVAAQAAFVSIDTPMLTGTNPMTGNDTYMVGGQSYDVFVNEENNEAPGSAAYNQRRDDYALVNPVDNPNSEELIFLGVHENIDHLSSGGAVNDVTVQLNNINAANEATGDVSLVLSGAEALDWAITLEAGGNINLKTIYVFGLEPQSITINGESLMSDAMGEFWNSTRIERSPVAICGYTLPANEQGCNTDRILGINRTGVDMFGFPTDTNGGDDNFLADLVGPGGPQLTSFNGTNLADGFIVDIDSIVVPLPPAIALMGFALSALFGRKWMYGQKQRG